MDPLAQTIRLLHPGAFTWKDTEASGDWAMRFPAHSGVAFCLVAEGHCRFEVPGAKPEPLEKGDFLLLAAPPLWVVSGGAPVPFVDFQSTGERYIKRTIEEKATHPVSRFLGGHFSFEGANTDLLTRLLPAKTIIRADASGGARLREVLALIEDEAAAGRPGRDLVLERLLEVMLVETIRHGAELGGSDMRPGLLSGLADRHLAAALTAIHDDVAGRWTVRALADIAGVSRSAFADKFMRIVGLPPIEYLLQWRMGLAREALHSNEARLDEIAFACGYESASAFSTAFKRVVGISPAKYAADARSPKAPAPALP